MERVIAEVVLPCLDEAAALPGVLGALPAGMRAIVVDNGSRDGSADVAEAHGAIVVHESRRGFGAAVHAGVLAATADIVAVCDADGSFDTSQLTRVVDPVAAGDADLVLARRRPVRYSAWPTHARIANLALARIIRRATGLPLHDLGPMRAARREMLLSLDLQDRRSGYPLEMLLRAVQEGWRVTETEASYLPRSGRSKVTGTVRGTITAVRDMRGVIDRVGAVRP